MNDVYENMRKKGILLPKMTVPSGVYATMVEFGNNLFYTSGKGWTHQGRPVYTGKLGKDLTIAEGKKASRMSILNILGNVEAGIGDLNKIKKIVKILGFVSSSEDFYDQVKVLNGASEVLVEIFGEEVGKGARSAIGVNVLPFNMPVEIEMIFEVK